MTSPDTVRLRWAEARALTLRQNPELLAAGLDTAVARGELRQAGLLFRLNPSADLLAAGGGTGLEVGVSQELEVFNQQGTRRAAGRAGLDRAAAEVADASRLTLGEADRALYRLIAATRQSELADEVLALNRRLADVAGRQLGEGEISRLEFNLATIELGRSRSRALAAQRERTKGNIELARLLGLRRGTVIVPLADSVRPLAAEDSGAAIPPALFTGAGAQPATLELKVDSLTALALAQRPDLAERGAAIRQAEAQAAVARREALPNLIVRGTSQREAGASRAFRPGVGLALPLFNRNQGEIQARRAAAAQAGLERAALTTKVRAEVASAVAAYESAAAEVAVLETTVLAPARQNRKLLEAAFREGKIGLTELLLIRNQAIDAELDYWTAWLTEQETRATLDEATGQNLSAPAPGAR